MAKKTTIKPYASEQRPGETLTEWYKRLAMTADKRLQRAEKYSQEEYFKPALTWAYAKAQHDIKRFRGDEANRFGLKPPKTEAQIKSQINAMRKYLASPSSTKRGIIEIYQKRADTFNKKYGTQFTWESLAKYFESGTAENWEKKFGSKTALRTIGKIQKNEDKIKEAIEKNDSRDIRVGNKLLNRTIQMALNDSDLDINELFDMKKRG